MNRSDSNLRRASIALGVCAVITLILGTMAEPAAAGTFVLHQCGGAKQAKGGFQPAEPHGSSFEVVDKCSDGGSSPALEVTQISNTTESKRGFWYLSSAHPSLRIAAVSARVKLAGGSGTQARLSAMNGDPTEPTNASGWGTLLAEGSAGEEWRTVNAGGLDHSWLKLGLECANPTCYLRDSPQVTKGRNFEITMRDSGDPTVSGWGPLVNDGALIKGTQAATLSATDAGAGVDFIEARVNGVPIDRTENDCPNLSGGFAVTQAPCTGTHAGVLEDDTSLEPWRYGANAVQVCAFDFRGAGTANASCTNRTVRVDDRPDGPTSFTTPINRWLNDQAKFAAAVGVPSSVAPLTRLHYRLIGPGGYEWSGDKTSGFSSASGSELPALGRPGVYSLRAWFEDSLGNVNESGTARSVELRYDPVKPDAARLDAHNGWISSYDFDPAFTQRWSKPANDGEYPSGLRGYAVSISSDQQRDPCDGGPTPGCDAIEITHGPTDQGIRLERGDLLDGRYYVSSVPVTNADNRGPRDQVELRIDRTNPSVAITGVPSGWSREPVSLTVRAEDAMSGMQPAATAGEMPDGPPVTAVRIGDQPAAEAVGNTVRATVSSDGVHRLSYYARDLAGNRNDGSAEAGSGYRFAAPGTATVRVDTTAPTGAFETQRRDDPTLQRIEVTDGTSGVDSVSIQLRQAAGDRWYALATSRDAGEYTARIDETRWPQGTYEMRAVATDSAGNTALLDSFEDGRPARLSLPLRERAEATIDAPGARATRGGARARWHKVAYGERPIYVGRLLDVEGDPIAHARVHVRERFDAGSVVKQRLLPAMTDRRGHFRVSGSAGPSRTSRVVFDGDRRYRPTRSTYVRTLVRGAVRLTDFPRTIRAGQQAVFRGRIAREGIKMPRRGKLYEVQLLVPGEGWKTLDQAHHSRRNGRFRFLYRFRPVLSPVTFRMRVLVKRDPEWAYTQARSRKVAVTVRP